MAFTNTHELGTSGQTGGGYGDAPNAINATDIRSMTIYDPVVATQMTLASNSNWQQLTLTHATGNTLENGVRIKNINTTAVNVGYYHPDTETGTTGGLGFQLEDREELFLEVRYLTDVRVKGSAASISYIAS